MRQVLLVLALLCAPLPPAAADPRTDHSPALNECIATSLLEPVALNACRGVVSERCRAEQGDATFALVLCISDEADAWGRIVAAVTTRLRTSGETDALALLDGVETQWQAYREAECAYRQSRFGTGSGAQVEYASCMADLSADRAIDLLIYEPTAD
jgi:uncharacterized protein YecT (DUF1311 family)